MAPPLRRRRDAPAAAPGDVHYFSLDELRAEMQKLAWTKGDYHHRPVWHPLGQSGRGDGADLSRATIRSTCRGRGTDENGDCYGRCPLHTPGIRPARSADRLPRRCPDGGKVEIDFERTIDVENKSSVLLRHAYVEVKNDDFRLLAGQTWDVISPLCPGVLFYSVGWDGGNIGYRRPQFRGERYMRSLRHLRVDRARLARTPSRRPTRPERPRPTRRCLPTGRSSKGGWPRYSGLGDRDAFPGSSACPATSAK